MSEQFTRKDVDTIARLARLELAPDEQELFARQLTDILAYANHVQDVDTSGVPPTAHALESSGLPGASAAGLPLRDDAASPSLPREDAQAAAPLAAHGLFKVPRVLG